MSNLTFTDFKLTLGIKTQDNNVQYAQLLKAMLKELYSTYGIVMCKDLSTHTEDISGNYGEAVNLTYKNIDTVSINGFTEGVDFTVDYNEGTLTILSTGSMLEATTYSVVYTYYVFINESNEIIYSIYPDVDTLTYYVDLKPVELLKVTLGGVELERDSAYYWYNNTLELTSAPTNNRTPYVVHLSGGYETTPNDLKEAFYEAVGIRFDHREKKTYLVSKVSDNATGTTTTYADGTFPKYIKDIFYEYTGRRFVQ